MLHHYGRHGPRAWLRRHKRRYRSSLLPVPVRPVVADLTLTDPGVTIVRVHLPANVERVIFIMIGNSNDNNEENRQELEVTASRDLSFVDSSLQNIDSNIPKLSIGSNKLISNAQWQAFHDAKEIKKLSDSGKFVEVDWEAVELRIEHLVDTYLQQNSPDGGPPSRSVYEELVTACRNAYRIRFNEEISSDSESIGYIHNPAEARLREIAIRDRQNAPTYSDRDYHIRDIAVVRVLQEIHTPVDIAVDRLTDIHRLADKYQEYFSTPRKGVIWPGQTPF